MSGRTLPQSVLTEWVIIIIFLGFILIPEINRQLLIFPDSPSTEKRPLAPYPTLDFRKIDDFTKNFDRFYNDHFGFRILLVKMNTFLHVKLFGISGVQSVVIGKDGWLFINDYGPTDRRGFAGWHGYFPYSPNELKEIQRSLEAETQWFIENNITFFILPSPDKNTIYSEYLPWQFDHTVGPSRQAQIFDHMKLHSKLELIDVRETLLSAKNSYKVDTYYKTDSHWNSIGAFFAYEKVMKRLLTTDSTFIPHRWEDFVHDNRFRRPGDLAQMANLDVSHTLEQQIIHKNNVSINNLGNKKRKLLIFGDSYSNFYFKDYFRRHFNSVIFVSGGRRARTVLDKHVILTEKPDVVIFESVERYWTQA